MLLVVNTTESRQNYSKLTWHPGFNRIAVVSQIPSHGNLAQTHVEMHHTLLLPQQWKDQAGIRKRQSRPKLKLTDFYILHTLGTGSFGRVHLVQSRVNSRYYAVKVLKNKI